MMAYFLYGWDRNWRDYESAGLGGRPFDHAASNNFGRLGVEPGDVVYVAVWRDAKMVLAGRLPVAAVVGKAEAEARLGRPVFDRRDHVLADPPDSTLSFTRVVPEDVARSLRTESDRALGFENDDEYRLTRQALRPMMRLASESAAALDRLLDVVPDVDPVVPGYAGPIPQAVKIAVELRAIVVTTVTLESQGWTVANVGATESFDLDCSRGDELLHVEVKGTVGTGERVALTANEVDHARRYPDVALAVVKDIQLSSHSMPTAEGGTLVLLHPWDVDSGELTPTAFSYVLPGPRSRDPRPKPVAAHWRDDAPSILASRR